MAEENIKLLISPAPHIKETRVALMKETLIALLPATVVGIAIFGARGLLPVIVSIIAAVAAEITVLKIRKMKPTTSDIGSSVLTGLLLAMMLPPALPWYAVSVGAIISIVIAKHFFGGLGFNIFNPALVGRAFLLASWPVMMTTWLAPFAGVDTITTATPLAITDGPSMLLTNMAENGSVHLNLLLGAHAGSIGETSALALIIGGLYLLWRKVIEWRIPLAYIGTVAILAAAFNQDPIFHVLAGGLMLGALFMATDLVTSPVTKPGRWIFGIGCGVITMVIRLFGGYPEGVCYAILIMNAAVPLLDRYFKGRRFGV
jgi:electron transport complex protein RnfD